MLIENYISPQSKTLSQLFLSGRFDVPHYQRSYSWTEELVLDLLADILYAVEQREPCYFLGSVILSGNTGEKREESLEIVDGQQRAVTLSLLILGLIDFIEKQKLFSNDDSDKALLFQLRKLLVYSPPFDIHDKSKIPRLSLNDKEGDACYKNMILGIKQEKSKIRNDMPKRLLGAHKIIVQFLEEVYGINDTAKKSVRDIRLFIGFILDNILVTTITTNEDQIDAYEVFEVLNDRRLELTQIDLLKNYFFRKVENQNRNAARIRKEWEDLEESFKPNNEKYLKHCMESYFGARFGYFQPKKLYRKVRNETEEKSHNKRDTKRDSTEIAIRIESYICDLGNGGGAACYLQIRNNTMAWNQFPKTTQRYVNFLRDFDILYSSLLVPFLKRDWEPEIIDKYYQLLYYVMLRIYATTNALPVNRLQPLFANLANEIYLGKLRTLEDVKNKYIANRIGSTYPQTVDNNQFTSLFISPFTVKGKKPFQLLSAMLDGIEEADIYNLECVPVLPLKADLNQWNNFNKENYELYKQRIGNYVLIEKELIDDSKDKLPYEQKKLLYDQSKIPMTKSISTDFSVWSAHSIKKRQENMVDEACKLWSIDKVGF